MASELVQLVGGPGDGEEHRIAGKGDTIRWEPQTDHEKIALRMLGRIPSSQDPVKYRRSLRTRNLFLYQP